MRIALLPLSLAVLALGLFATSASASKANAIIKDCSTSDTGLLKGSYSKADLRAARKLVRGDVAEYTGCMDAINDALSGGGGNGNGSNGNNGGNGSNGTGSNGGSGGTGDATGSGGGFGDGGNGALGGGGADGSGGGVGGSGTSGGAGTTVPGSGAGTPPQQAGSGAPVAVGSERITPGIPASFSRDQRALPTPLIVFLVLLAAGAIGFGAPTIGRRVLARRRG
jgi:hypothetical protein